MSQPEKCSKETEPPASTELLQSLDRFRELSRFERIGIAITAVQLVSKQSTQLLDLLVPLFVDGYDNLLEQLWVANIEYLDRIGSIAMQGRDWEKKKDVEKKEETTTKTKLPFLEELQKFKKF